MCRSRGRLRRTWKRTNGKEAIKGGKTWQEVKKFGRK
jgi:hypothetical protein